MGVRRRKWVGAVLVVGALLLLAVVTLPLFDAEDPSAGDRRVILTGQQVTFSGLRLCSAPLD